MPHHDRLAAARSSASWVVLFALLIGVHRPVRAELEAPAADLAPPAAAVPDAAEPALQQPSGSRHRRNLSPLDRRMALLAKELKLDASQQAQVKKLLERQREQVAYVWSNEAVPAAVRVSTTQSIGDRTADQIRALLSEEQRKNYIQARTRDTKVGAPGSDVEAWAAKAAKK